MGAAVSGARLELVPCQDLSDKDRHSRGTCVDIEWLVRNRWSFGARSVDLVESSEIGPYDSEMRPQEHARSRSLPGRTEIRGAVTTAMSV